MNNDDFRHGPPFNAPMPERASFPDEIAFARAMQRWGAADVPRDNPQRRQCIDDWFAEELLIEQAQTAKHSGQPTAHPEEITLITSPNFLETL